jgi:Sulfotransferase family
MDLTHAPLVFLHIPKTAGQTVHNSLARVARARRVSPIRVHTQALDPQDQFPAGYSLYSGHLDWSAVAHLPSARFIFTVLREPTERIASFYYYLRRQAQALDPASLNQGCNLGLKRALEWSPDSYFFGGDDNWQVFIRSHYDNFYCTYFATRRMLGWGEAQDLTERQLLAKARAGLSSLDGVYSTHNMTAMEQDFRHRFGIHLRVANRYDNTSGEPGNTLRWPRLLASFETDAQALRMQDLVARDHLLTSGLL